MNIEQLHQKLLELGFKVELEIGSENHKEIRHSQFRIAQYNSGIKQFHLDCFEFEDFSKILQLFKIIKGTI